MRYLFFVLPLVSILACSSTHSPVADENGEAKVDEQLAESPHITLSLRGASGDKVYLIGNYSEQRFRLDSAQISADGSATFSRDSPYPKGLYFAAYSGNANIQLLIDHDQTFSISADKSDILGSIEIEGSESNEWLYEVMRFEQSMKPDFDRVNGQLSAMSPTDQGYAAVKAEQDALVKKRTDFLESVFARNPDNFYVRFKRAGQNPRFRSELTNPDGSPDTDAQVYWYRQEFWDNVDFRDSSLLRTPVISNKLERYFDRLTPRNADSIIAAADHLIERTLDHPFYFQHFANWITLKYEPGESQLMDAEAVHVHMIRNYFTHERAFWSDSINIYGLQQRADQMAKSLMGLPAPNVKVPNANGDPVALYDETTPYIMVFMYNPDCDHCKEQTPKVKALAQSRSDLSVYAIAIDTDREAWLDFVQSAGLESWTNVFDPTNRSIFGSYYVDHTPELYLINPDRIIIGKNLKAHQVADVINRDQNKL